MDSTFKSGNNELNSIKIVVTLKPILNLVYDAVSLENLAISENRLCTLYRLWHLTIRYAE